LTLKTSAAIAISVFVVSSASLILLLPAFPMVTIPNVCATEIDCTGYASLSCVMFGVGGLDWNSHYYLSAGGDCHLTEQQAGISSITTNTTVTSNLGDD
jgi:hypothetical protein